MGNTCTNNLHFLKLLNSEYRYMTFFHVEDKEGPGNFAKWQYHVVWYKIPWYRPLHCPNFLGTLRLRHQAPNSYDRYIERDRNRLADIIIIYLVQKSVWYKLKLYQCLRVIRQNDRKGNSLFPLIYFRVYWLSPFYYLPSYYTVLICIISLERWLISLTMGLCCGKRFHVKTSTWRMHSQAIPRYNIDGI